MVRFPSSSEGDDGTTVDGTSHGEAEQGERLAPVTPLRRAATGRAASRGERDSGEGGATEGMRHHPSRRGQTRAVVELPSSPGQVPVGDGGWNNTWGAEPPGARSRPADDVDDETARQTRKTTGVAIRQLARRGMSRWELEQLLTRREIEPEVYGPELDRLEALGVIDDASLAATLAFTQHSRKGLGRTAIEQELKRRHIDPELIEAALDDIGEDDELERATELAVKRMAQLSSYDDETTRRRLHGFLARKGYASDVVRQAMDAAFATRRSRGGSGVRFQ